MRISLSARAGLLAVGSFLAFVSPEPSQGADSPSIGQVVKTRGTVWVTSGSGKRAALQGNDKVAQGALIETGKNSFVQLLLADRSVIKLGADARLKLQTDTPAADSVRLNLSAGRVRSIVTKKVSRSRLFQIRTSSATMGVRGTDFVVSTGSEGKNIDRSDVYVLHGSVQVSNLQGKELALVQAGNGLSLRAQIGEAGAILQNQRFTPQPLGKREVQTLSTDRFLMAAPKEIKIEVRSDSSGTFNSPAIAPLPGQDSTGTTTDGERPLEEGTKSLEIIQPIDSGTHISPGGTFSPDRNILPAPIVKPGDTTGSGGTTAPPPTDPLKTY